MLALSHIVNYAGHANATYIFSFGEKSVWPVMLLVEGDGTKGLITDIRIGNSSLLVVPYVELAMFKSPRFPLEQYKNLKDEPLTSAEREMMMMMPTVPKEFYFQIKTKDANFVRMAVLYEELK